VNNTISDISSSRSILSSIQEVYISFNQCDFYTHKFRIEPMVTCVKNKVVFQLGRIIFKKKKKNR